MNIRKYKSSDCDTLSHLFYDTVHSVNAADYTKAQLFAWADNPLKLKTRADDLLRQKTLIAEINGLAVGFGSIDKTGCLDLLFVHKDYLRYGIATALCDELEKGFNFATTYASITAKPFFEKRGYYILKESIAERGGVKLKNYLMKKHFI